MLSKPDLTSKLEKAYQQLQEAQRQVANLEAQLFEDPPKSGELADAVESTRLDQIEVDLHGERGVLERRGAEHTTHLQAALARVEAILNNSPDAILLANSDLTIQQANASFDGLFGTDWHTYSGKSLLTLIHPDDATHMKAFLQSAADQKGSCVEVCAVRSDGTTFDAELNIGIIKDDGFVCIIRDITHRKAQEFRLRYQASLQESVSDAVIVLDLANHVQSWNKAAEAIYGWTAEEAVGQHSSKFLRYEAIPEQYERDMRHLQDYGWLRGEIQQFHKDGHPIHIWSSITQIKDKNDRPLSFIAINHDITEHKRQEQQLRYHASIQESVSDAVIATDMDFKIQSWNHAAEAMYGWTATEVVGKPISEIVQTSYESEADRARNVQTFLERGSYHGEVIQHRQDGSQINILASVSLFKDNQGQPLGVVSVNRDITERKLTEQALQTSAREIYDLYNNAPCGYHSIDRNGLIVQINDTELRWLGYTREEVVGKFRITDVYTPESRELFRKEFSAFIVRGWVNDLEFDMVRKDGSTIRILLNGTAIYDENGHYLSSRSTLFDIIDLRQAQQTIVESEARYRLLAENIADVIMTFTPDRRITYMSPSCERLLGYLPSEVEGKSHSDFIHPDDYPQVLSRTRQAVASREKFYTNQFRLRHKAGQYVWYEVRTRLIFDQNTNAVVQFISVLRDIADRKRMDDVLRESEDRFRRAIIDAPFPIMLHADDGAILHISNEWMKISGYTHAEIPTMNDWVNKAYRETSHTVKPLIERVYSLTEARRGGEFRIWTKSGEERIWDFISAPLTRTSDGRQVVSSMAMDITDRKHTEEVLKSKMEEEHQFQSYLKALHKVVIELTTIDELDTFYKRVVELGREQLGFDRLAMFLYDGQDGSAICTFGIDTLGMLTDERGLRFKPDPNGPMQRSFERAERFYINEQATLFNAELPVGQGWNAAATLWNGTQTLGWLVADNLLSHTPATKTILEIIGLYALSVGALLAQKQTQLALRESETLHRLLAENINDVIARSTLTSECLYISPSVQALLGYTPQDLIGQLALDLIHPDDKADFLAAYASAWEGNTVIMPHQYRAQHKEGHYVWLETVGRPISGKENKEIVTSSRDITKRKQVEFALRQSEQMLINVVENIPVQIFWKDRNSIYRGCNTLYSQAIGMSSAEDVVGKRDADFFPDRADEWELVDRRVIDSGIPKLNMEEMFTDSNGSPHWLRSNKVPLRSANGEVTGVLVTGEDITQHKQAEQALRESEVKYRSLVETMRGGLATFDTEFRITYVNDRFCELLGYSREEAIGKQPTDFVDAAHMSLVRSQLEGHQSSANISNEIPVRHKNGQLIFMLMSGSPLLDKQGKYNGRIVVATDITIQKQAEEALQQALAAEKELGNLKTRFVSMASHEFRTPLATILALVETVSAYRKKLSEEQIDHRLDKIKDQVGHLKDIMEDVLMLARMQARRVEYSPAKVDLDALIRSILDEFQSRSDLKHRLVYTASEASYEAVIDRKLMRQMISNLVSNAIKYSPEDTVVRINLEYMVSALVLKVSDEGIGIPEADLPHLFEPFHRATNVGTISGTGLGLVITKEAVDLHRGTIFVESQLGIGTSFTILIPISSVGDMHNENNPNH